ncbi:MAG: two-component system response regulator [Gemmatimonadaceae bacterium]
MPSEDNSAPERPTILVLDDEPAIVSLLARILERGGFRVIVAADGKGALAALAARDRAVDLMVVDVKLPDMSGREFVHHAAARFGARPVLYVSGVDQRGRTDALHKRTVFLAKPFESTDVLERVRSLLES